MPNLETNSFIFKTQNCVRRRQSMFGFGKKKQNNSNNVSNGSMALEKPRISLEKLEKSKVSLDKHLEKMKKEQNIDLTKHICAVELYIDISGSMKNRFKSGKMQDALTRIFPVALKFDNDGVMPVSAFGNGCYPLVAMTMENYATYVEKQILSKHDIDESTYYAPFVKQAIKRAKKAEQYPLFNIVITDGNCWDETESDEAFRKSSEYKTFFQCVGIGDDKFKYLRKIDDLDGRKVDNTAFVKVDELEDLSDDELYAKLLEQYPQWLQAMHLI